MELCFWLNLFILYYIYDGYLRLLQIISFCSRRFLPSTPPIATPLPKVTVLITVFNESSKIAMRINNILESDYPADLLEILVASDGSTDGTDDIVRTMGNPRVRLFRPAQRSGKTDTQNQAIATATSDIILFTDADTRFDRMFLQNITAPFNNPQVGGVSGCLCMLCESASGVSKAQGFYWRHEIRLRNLETLIGIMALASGACMAIRRNLIRPMQKEIGEDCVVPLDVIEQGHLMVSAENAIAFDQMEYSPGKEFRARIRMTLRNWQGTWSRPALLNPLRHPGYALSLWSHKILRWLSPFFLGGLTLSALALATTSPLYTAVAGIIIGFYLAGLVGWMSELGKWQVPIVREIFSFMLANAGFLVGILMALFGRRIIAYRK
jgi:cellulose synthase/poly-beta-1,6-N-acetylglucosamine synthase-like glycosyltransferase